MKRLRFRLRTLLVGVAVICALLAAWRLYTTPRLHIEPAAEGHTKISGRFFMRNGTSPEYAGIAVFYTSPERKRSWPACGLLYAKETWWCVYEFNETFVMPMRGQGRYDVRLTTAYADYPEHWFSFGDRSLPSWRDESLGPFGPAPPSQDFIRR